MANDNAPQDAMAPVIIAEGHVLSLVPGVDILAPITDMEGHDEDLLAEDVDVVLEPLSLRLRSFNPATYRPRTHTMAVGGMLRFTEFSWRVAKDMLLRKCSRDLSHDSSTIFIISLSFFVSA